MSEKTRDSPTARLEARIRGMQWLACWALLLGLGVGFYAGFTIGAETAREAAQVLSPGDP
jgi:formate-dependent nitrite reductase membrane component NrfD